MYFKIIKPISWGKRPAERRSRFIQRFPNLLGAPGMDGNLVVKVHYGLGSRKR